MNTMQSYSDLSETIRSELISIEVFINDVDAEDIDVEDAVNTFNRLVDGIRALTAERPVAVVREAMWRDIAETLCAVDGNGFLHEASPTQQAAYEVRAKAVAALTAERPKIK